MDSRTAGALRGLISEAYVLSVQDDGEVQTVSVLTHAGIIRTGVAVAQPFGLAGVPPPGATVLVLAVGGDQGNMIALPASHAGHRMGGFAPGEGAIYDEFGNRVAVRRGGKVEILAAAVVEVKSPGVVIEAPGPGVNVVGNVWIEGNLVVTGSVSDGAGSMQEMRDRYNAHDGHGAGGPPTPLMD